MRTCLALALVSLVGGCSSSSGTLLVVTVDSAVQLHDVRSFHIVASGGGRTRSFDVTSPSSELPPAQTIGIEVPPDVSGTLTVHIDVIDGSGSVVAADDVSAPLDVGHRTDVSADVTVGGGDDMAGGDMAGGADVDMAGGDLAGSGGDMVVPADLAHIPVCGDSIRDPLEGCDDGNTTSNDGCSSSCAIEPDFRTPFVGTALSLNGAWMDVASDGTIWVKQSGGGGGIDSTYKIDNAANVTPNALSGTLARYGGSLRTIGTDVYGCGNYIETTSMPQHNHGVCQKWTAGAGSPTTVLDAIDLTYYYNYATSNGTTWWFNTNGDFRKSTGVSTSTQVSTTVSGAELYHPTLGILVANGSSIMKDTGGSGTGPWAAAYTLSAGNVGAMTLDRNGKLWVTCTTTSGTNTIACPSGSVWIVDLAAMTTKPGITNFAIAQGVGYDPNGHYIVLLAQSKLWRFPN